jgi:hypothetical protein
MRGLGTFSFKSRLALSSEIECGFFPGAKVQVQNHEKATVILYHRPNGKVSKQIFDTQQIEMNYFLKAAERW